MDMVDKDRSGDVTFDEYCDFMGPGAEDDVHEIGFSMTDEEMMELFSMADLNGDGTITLEEVDTLLTLRGVGIDKTTRKQGIWHPSVSFDLATKRLRTTNSL